MMGVYSIFNKGFLVGGRGGVAGILSTRLNDRLIMHIWNKLQIKVTTFHCSRTNVFKLSFDGDGGLILSTFFKNYFHSHI